MWLLTVASVTTSRAAISLLERPSATRDELDRLVAVRSGADYLDTRQQAEQRRQPLADDALIVREHDGGHAGTHSSTRKPAWVGAAVSFPPSSSARSRMPVRP